MKRSYIAFISAVLLLSLILGGCKTEFRYAEDIEYSVNIPREEYPWEVESEFTYVPSEDAIDRVTNFTDSALTWIEIFNGKLFFMQPSRPILYSPETNAQAYVCTDPLCDHGHECPFSMSSMTEGLHVVNDFVIYYKGNHGGPQVAKYSRTDRTVKILRTIEGNFYTSQMAVLEDCYYFTDIVYDEETKIFTYSLCRQYYDSKEIEVLKSSNNYDYWIIGADGDVVYYYDYIKCVLVSYSATLHEEISSVNLGKDFAGISLCKDGYVIYSNEAGDLMRANTDGSDQRSLGIGNVLYFYITNSYIYYMVVEDTVTGKRIDITSNGVQESEIELDLQTIYRTDHEGNNKELVWKNEDESSIMEFMEFVVIGNYLYATFNHNYLDEGYFNNTVMSGQGEDRKYYYSRIDCTTGEIYYIKLE